MVLALVKHSDDLLSFCRCEDAFATTGQMDCPWCGCGWLFSCTKCRKAFAFAELRDVPQTYQDIARESWATYVGRPLTAEDDEAIAEEVAWLSYWQDVAPAGTPLVLLDGNVLPLDARDVSFDGWFGKHDLKTLPHTAKTAKELDDVLGAPAYWYAREHETDS